MQLYLIKNVSILNMFIPAIYGSTYQYGSTLVEYV